MVNKFASLLVYCLFFSMPMAAIAAKHYNEPQYAELQGLDKKSKTITVRNTVYKLRQAVKLHDPTTKFPSLSNMVIGREIKFKTRINKRTGQTEISEIWIQYP